MGQETEEQENIRSFNYKGENKQTYLEKQEWGMEFTECDSLLFKGKLYLCQMLM